MHDWNRDGHIDNTDRTIDFMAYNSAMNENNTPKRTTPKEQASSNADSAAVAVWVIIAAFILIALICR